METRYFATGNYRADHRNETAHAMKNGERWAIFKAAAEMVKYIPSNAALVPMPSHSGAATYTSQAENASSLLTMLWPQVQPPPPQSAPLVAV